jgi:hypothetical protein
MKSSRAKKLSLATVGVALTAALVAASAPAGFGPTLKPKLKAKRIITSKIHTISGLDTDERFEVFCPRGLRPLGGGVGNDPPPDPMTGAGAYQVSYERLGQQDGFHGSVSHILRPGSTQITLQVLCRRYRGDIDPVEHFIKSTEFKNIGAGETKRFTETCPKSRRIIDGGYLSSHFFATKGVYVTESRMASPRSWTVLAHGVAGGNGGQITAIAYCLKSKKNLLSEVASAPGKVTPGLAGTATTPACPGGKKLISGGFSAPASVRVYDGFFASLDSWTASAVSYTGVGEITALGYCL